MSKNKINELILNIKSNFNEEEVLEVMYKNFPQFVLLEVKKETYIYRLSKEYMYDSHQKIIFKNSIQIKLTKKESQVLELLLKYSSRVVTYSEFENYIWANKPMTNYAIRSIIKSLRKKLPIKVIENFSGLGYKLSKNNIFLK